MYFSGFLVTSSTIESVIPEHWPLIVPSSFSKVITLFLPSYLVPLVPSMNPVHLTSTSTFSLIFNCSLDVPFLNFILELFKTPPSSPLFIHSDVTFKASFILLTLRLGTTCTNEELRVSKVLVRVSKRSSYPLLESFKVYSSSVSMSQIV